MATTVPKIHITLFRQYVSQVIRNPASCSSTNLNVKRYSSSNIKIFEENATKWWTGKEFAVLRAMNGLRVPFITNNLGKPLDGGDCNLLDIGCGGGILSEPLARLGANVTGVDPVFESVNQAILHSQLDPQLKGRLQYKNCNIEDLTSIKENLEKFDGIVASEVLEHIEDVEDFLSNCHKLLKPNGSLFITTINQTPLSWLGVIFMGEYVLKQLPKGTHEYNMFVSVKALRIMLQRLGYQVRLINGFMYEPLSGTFHWTPTTLTHYALHAIKEPPTSSAAQSSKPGTMFSNHQNNNKTINHEQRRNMSKASANRIEKPKRPLDKDDLMQIIPYDQYLAGLEKVCRDFAQHLDRLLTTTASTATLEKLPIQLEGLDEPIELCNLAQINLKGSNLIVINLSSNPDAIKPTMQALESIESMKPQVEVHHIYVPVPRVTRDHRKQLASDAKRSSLAAKDKLKELFSGYSAKARSSNGVKGVSQDLIRDTIENIRFDMEKRRLEIEKLLEQRVDRLLSQKN